MLNEVEKMAAEMPKKKKKSLRAVSRDNGWLMPCYRFRGNTVEQQMKKVREEVEEVAEAYRVWQETGDSTDKQALLMECADIQQTVETLMNIIGADYIERSQARRLVWQKNNDRNYYKRKR